MKEYEVDIRKLDNLSIYQLREVGARVGVRNPTTLRSAELRQQIIDIVTGKQQPYLKSKSGRPHKPVIKDEEWDDIVGFNNTLQACSPDNLFSLHSASSSIYPTSPDTIYSGYIIQIQGALVLAVGDARQIRINKFARINADIEHYKLLKQGDVITATLSREDNERANPYVTAIKSINGETDFKKLYDTPPTPNSTTENRKNLPKFSYNYPQLRFLNEELPVMAGQRALFIGADINCGQEFLANSIARDLSNKFYVVFYSCNKPPEDEMDFEKNVDYFFSTFDINPRNIVFDFEVALARAVNLSRKTHTIFIVDNLMDIMTSYARLLQEANSDNSANIYEEAFQQIKSLFAIKGITNLGSLTLFAFTSTPKESELANYIAKMFPLVNCRYVLDQTAFLQGDTEFLVRSECHTTQPRSNIID